MDAKLTPISSSAAGTQLAGKSIAAESGDQPKSNDKLAQKTVQDTFETSDREADGKQPLDAKSTDQVTSDDNRVGRRPKDAEQGSLLDLEG